MLHFCYMVGFSQQNKSHMTHQLTRPFPIIAIQLNRPEKASKVFEKCEYIQDATNFLSTP